MLVEEISLFSFLIQAHTLNLGVFFVLIHVERHFLVLKILFILK